jgi:cyclase
MNRRSFLARSVPAGGALALAWRHSFAADPKEPLALSNVAEHIDVITGAGGNVTVFNSSDGVLLVDGGSPERSADVLKLVKQHTGAAKVHTLFNTHWHWDQTGSNTTLGKAGTRIIAHENTKLWLGTEVNSKWEKRVYPPLPAVARPNKTTYTTDEIKFGGQTIAYGYLPQAHTDGDIYVLFKEANVLVAGGVVSVASYPVIDYCTNGWIGGMATATETLLGLCNAETRIIPANGAIQSRANLEAEHAMLAAMRQKLAQLLAKGLSAKDMVAAAPTRDYDKTWGDPTLFVMNSWPGLVNRARELGVSIV